MGEVVKRTRRGKQALAAVICASWMALVATGCSSAPAPKTTVAQPTAAAASQTPSEPTAEVTALDLREGAPGVLVDVSASGPLVWTSYRDADGALVVELPNTTVSPTLQGLNPDSGMVAAVAVVNPSSFTSCSRLSSVLALSSTISA